MAAGRRSARALLAVSTLLASVASIPAATATPAGAATAPKWSIEKSANRAGVSNVLSDVSCPSAAKCVGVGAYRNHRAIVGGTPAGTLIETFTAGKWTANASPGQGGLSRLLGVSCPTASRCYAIGQSHTKPEPLIVTSSGGPWIEMATPTISDPTYFSSISCGDATHCIAIGGTFEPQPSAIILSLANGVWSSLPVPDLGSTPFGVGPISCVSATRCVAVGQRPGLTSARTLALQLAGGAWTVMPTPNRTVNDNALTGIACTSATRCTAIGQYRSTAGPIRTLIESWNGTSWSLVASPNRGSGDHLLSDVACTVASLCVAVGRDGNGNALIERLSGGVWTIPAMPLGGAGYALSGVDCISASACVAVGSAPSPDPFVQRTLVLRSASG